MSRITSDTNEVFGHSKMIQSRAADYGSVGSYHQAERTFFFQQVKSTG